MDLQWMPYKGNTRVGFKEVYDWNWPKQYFSQFDIELFCFREKLAKRMKPEDGGVNAAHHFKEIAKALWPEDGKDGAISFIWNPWADKLLEYSCKENFIAIAGGAGWGKCLAPHVEVLMYDGSKKKAKDVVLGDKLMGDDSQPRTVVHRQDGRSNMVRIVPWRGDSWECNDDHMLTLKCTWDRNPAKIGEIIDISVKDYLAKGPKFKRNHQLFVVGVDFPEQDVEFDPRAYGIWLGDGSACKAHITSPDSEVEVNEYIVKYFESKGYNVKKEYYGKSCPTWMISTDGGCLNNPFLDFVRESSGYKSLGDYTGKRILPRYLYNSREVRMQLLAGLLDADGYTNGVAFEISCSYKGLDEDIVFLARSLGFKVTMKDKIAKLNGKEYPTKTIKITGEVWQIPTLRKKARKKLRTKSECVSFKVEQLGEGDWSGFKVDGNGRFLLADFTVTHNSEFFAIWAIVNFLADPKNTLVFVTSTTLSASKKRIWGKIAKYWSAIDSRFPYGKLVDSAGMIRYIEDGVPVMGDLAGITLVPAEKKKEKDAMGKIQGMHQERIIFIADEHSEISEAVAEAAIYNLKLSASFFQFIGISNPASYTDAFGSFAKPKDGWESISVEHDEWETERGVCLHFDLTRNPNVMAGRKIYGWMPSQEDIDAEMKVHGGNTSGFWRMYRGFWVPAGVDDNVFTEVEIINAKATQKAVWLDNKLTRCSFIDPSFTNGGDRTVACFGTFGTNMEGLKVLQFDEWLIFQEDVTDKTLTRSQQVASWWRNACIQRGVAPRHAGMDVTGAGGPLSDMIAIVWSRDIFKLNFGGKASELPVSAFDPTPSHERYVNSCTEIWFSTKEYMLTGQIKGIDKDCMREMTLRKIDRHGEKNIGLRLKVLPKSEMKSKHGFSPDYAEAALGLCALARERLGFHTREGAKAISNEPENTTTYKKIFDKWKAIY